MRTPPTGNAGSATSSTRICSWPYNTAAFMSIGFMAPNLMADNGMFSPARKLINPGHRQEDRNQSQKQLALMHSFRVLLRSLGGQIGRHGNRRGLCRRRRCLGWPGGAREIGCGNKHCQDEAKFYTAHEFGYSIISYKPRAKIFKGKGWPPARQLQHTFAIEAKAGGKSLEQIVPAVTKT